MKSLPDNLKKDFDDEDGFDLKRVVAAFQINWYLFLIAIPVCLGLAFLYTLSASPLFRVNSQITVEDQGANPLGKSVGTSGAMDFSDLLGTPNNAYNEMDIIRSRKLMYDVVREMQLNIVLYKKDQFGMAECYDDAPFNVLIAGKSDFDKPHVYDIEVNKGGFQIKNHFGLFKFGDPLVKKVDGAVKFGQPVDCGGFNLILTQKDTAVEPGAYRLVIQSAESKMEELVRRLSVDLTDKKSTTMSLTFEYTNPTKGEAILEKLMDVYLRYNVVNKQQIADSTLAFIDNRLKIVSSELSAVESKFTDFKQENNIAAVDEQSKALIGNVSTAKGKQDELEIQLSVLDDISRKLNDPASKQIIPSSMAVADPVFAAAIGSYDQLLMQRRQLELSYKESNPVIKNLDGEIEAAHQSLLKSFDTYRNSIVVSLNSLKGQNAVLYNQVKSVPKKERVFLDYARQQNLKQELYLYLLQKREETAITRTSTISTARIIDPARSESGPFKPNKLYILMMGLGAGILLPLGFVSLKKSLSNKIISRDDVVKNTPASVIGEIGNNSENRAFVVGKGTRTLLSEQFRALRTNLQFILPQKKGNVILITSSKGREGKSFITLNLAGIIAATGKKVVMIELDLRKPKLSDSLNMSHDYGFTNYAISNTLRAADIIKPTEVSENVWIVSSGPIPPNPAELLLSGRLSELIGQLRSEFDFIVIDSAPVGLVSDAQIIEQHADISLYIVRQNFTYKSQLDILNHLMDDGKFRKPYVIINDIKKNKRAYYGFGYHGATYGDYIKEGKG
ncbi:GumC family protein [Puia sp.]|jgi:capsular exopolysaccharide synthesis family protein|uniref:GumC family protein n=1 Tax=Puia sp. TaxID=2045100 RepID=UPI002F412FEF